MRAWQLGRDISGDEQTIGFQGRHADKLRITYKAEGMGSSVMPSVMLATHGHFSSKTCQHHRNGYVWDIRHFTPKFWQCLIS